MRRFVIVSHTGDASGTWSLDDLCGGAGRIDVLCRAVNSALFLSHGMRQGIEVVLVFVAASTAVRIRSDSAHRMNPDERSIASRIQAALQAAHPDPWWHEVQSGIDVAPYGLAEVLDEADDLVLLDPEGEAIEAAALPEDPTVVLSDHRPFTAEEYALLDDRGAQRVSLGEAWYHGNHVMSVVQHVLDRQHGISDVR